METQPRGRLPSRSSPHGAEVAEQLVNDTVDPDLKVRIPVRFATWQRGRELWVRVRPCQ